MQFISLASTATLKSYPSWEKAAISTKQADPFCCTPDWQLSFHEAYSPNRRLLIEETSDCTIAFAEKFFSPRNVYLTPIEPNWFFGCPLLGRYAVELLSEAMSYFARRYRSCYPKILISGIRPGGTLCRRLLQTFDRNFNISFHSEVLQCMASLAGGIDGYLSRRSANHRSKLKKGARRAREHGISFERISPSSFKEAESVYSRMLHVEQASWKGIGQCGMAKPPEKQFYATMMRRLSVSQKGRIIFAKHETKDIGFIFGGMAGNIYRGQQFSYDDAWKHYSLGNLMQIEQIKWLCEEGAKRYDMGMGPLTGPRMEYKSHWTEQKAKIQTWILEKTA